MPCGFKLLMLLSTPFPIRPFAAIRFTRHSCLQLEVLFSTAASHGRIFSAVPSSKLGLWIRAAEKVHTKAVTKEGCNESVASSPRFMNLYSWPEWSKLADHLLSRGYSKRLVSPGDEDDFLLTDVNLPEQFLKAIEACLDFARERPDILRLLNKEYIELVVKNGSPVLFKNGEKSVSRMRLFLCGDASSALESEKAQTIDIMRYLLSYVYKTLSTSNGNQFKADESVETSVRKLLYELFNFIGQRSKLTESTKAERCLGNEQLTRPPGPSFEIKRGDWICQKCTYLNFGRNMSCLECGEARPRRLLTGAEWECPQCDFFNYGRNISCLRCDCRRPAPAPAPAPAPSPSPSPSPSPGHRNGSDNTSDTISRSLDRILGRSWTTSGNPSTDGDNNASSKQEAETSSDLIDSLIKSSETAAELENAKDPANAVSDEEDFPDIMPIRKGESRFVVSKKKDRSSTSPAYKRRLAAEQANNYNTVPFVPFPPGYFAKKDNQQQLPTDSIPLDNNNRETSMNTSSSSSKSLEGSCVAKAPDPLDMSEEAKAERWFRRIAQMKDISELSQIPDEDFPEIMPMRKGVNRFVVSKRKTPLERRLTSPQYRRNLPTVSSEPDKDDHN